MSSSPSTTMTSPSPLRIYQCPADPCTHYSTSLAAAITHLSSAHPVFHAALQRDFGAPSLALFIAPLDLLPARLPSASTVILCLRCQTIHATASAATTHVATSAAHAASAALDRARYGPAASRCHMPLMHTVSAPPASDTDRVLLRALVGDGGAALMLPRTTALVALPGLLQAREPGVEWDVLVRAGMQLVYVSVKMGGGSAVMFVKDESAWRRVMRDVAEGERVEWVVR